MHLQAHRQFVLRPQMTEYMIPRLGASPLAYICHLLSHFCLGETSMTMHCAQGVVVRSSGLLQLVRYVQISDPHNGPFELRVV